MKARVVLAQVLVAFGASIAVALLIEAIRERRAAAPPLPEPLAPGHDSA